MSRSFESPVRMEELLQHAGWLRTLAASLVADPARADDLVQDTWLAALRHPPLAGRAARPWLERVVRNLARSRHRSAGTRADHEARVEAGAPRPGPDAIAEEVEAQRLLVDAVARLADPARTIVVLRYFRGLDASAIGRELGLPAGTVRWKLKAALEELRRVLDGRFGGERKAWSLALTRLLGATVPPAAAVTAPWLVAAAAVVAGVAFFGARHAAKTERESAPASTAIESLSAAARVSIEAPAETQADEEARSENERSPLQALAAPRPLALDAPDIAGSVLVDGAPPTAPIDLVLYLEGYAEAQLPPMHMKYRTLSTDEHGRFTVFAAGIDSNFTLRAPAYLPEGGAPTLLVTPVSDLVLRLRTPPAIRGRVVTAAHEPVPRAHGAHYLHASTASVDIEPGREEFECGDDGRFEISLLPLFEVESFPLTPDDTCTATLLFEVPRVGRAQVETGPFSAANLELGDVQLEPAHALRFHVRDEQGAFMSGAVARLDDTWLTKPSSPTNRDGAGELRSVPDRPVPVRFSALGYVDRVLQVELGDEPDVWLEPSVLLEVQLEPPANTYGPFPTLVLVARSEPFERGNEAARLDLLPPYDPDWIQTELGATQKVGHLKCKDENGLRVEARYRPDSGGRVRITGLLPDVPLSLEARGAKERVLARCELVLSAGERKRVALPYEKTE